MKNLLYILFAFAFLLTGCSEDKKESYPPTYSGFEYSPIPAHPGDSVTVSIVQAKKGKYLNATSYSLNVRLSYLREGGEQADTTLSIAYKTNYDGTDNGNPTFRFKLPETTTSDRANCSFSAYWSNSTDGIGGSFGQSSIRSYSYVLYSNASGSFTFPIAQ